MDFVKRENMYDYIPIIVIIHATMYERDPIQTIHMKKVSGNQLLNLGSVQSGIVNEYTKCIGHVTIQVV